MVSRAVSEFVVRYLSDTGDYERGAQRVERANAQVERSEERLERQRQAREAQGDRRARRGGGGGGGGGGRGLGQQAAGIGSGLAATAGLSGLTGIAGQAGLGRFVSSPAGLALGLGGAAALGVAGLGAAAIQASRSLGTLEGIELSEEWIRLKHETRLLLAEWGTVLLPAVTAVARGLRNMVEWLRSINLLNERTITGGGRSDAVLGQGTGREVIVTGGRPPRPLSQQERERERVEDIRQRRAEGRERIENQGVPSWFSGVIFDLRRDLANLGFDPPERGAGPPRLPIRTPDLNLFNRGAPPQDLQTGGIVRPRPGGTLARIAEGGEAEAVAPLTDLARLLGLQSMRSEIQEQRLAERLQTSLQHAQDLPPLYSRVEPQAAAGGGTTNVNLGSPVRIMTQTDFDALTNKLPNTYYVIVEATSE